jgi:hypothetical protein
MFASRPRASLQTVALVRAALKAASCTMKHCSSVAAFGEERHPHRVLGFREPPRGVFGDSLPEQAQQLVRSRRREAQRDGADVQLPHSAIADVDTADIGLCQARARTVA